MQQSNGTRNEIEIELDREKIEREGEYDYIDLVEYLDTEFAEQGFIRKTDTDVLCYYSDEPNNLLKQAACYARVAREPAIFNNLKKWQIAEYQNMDFITPVMVENVLDTIARHGGNPLW